MVLSIPLRLHEQSVKGLLEEYRVANPLPEYLQTVDWIPETPLEERRPPEAIAAVEYHQLSLSDCDRWKLLYGRAPRHSLPHVAVYDCRPKEPTKFSSCRL